MNELKRYGFSERFEAAAAAYTGLCPARVVAQYKSLYRVMSAEGELMAALSGRLGYEAASASDLPTVGDFVMLERGGADDSAVIRHILPRKSVFVRRAAGTAHAEQLVAANIDTVFVCMSLNNDFNLRRLERYVAACWNGGALPVLVLTKADLVADTDARQAEAASVAAGAEVLVTSSLETDGLAQLRPYIREGQTVAFIGSSGVGKSTLINRLIGADVLCTKGLRDDDKGRHTTTNRALFLLPGGGLVIDTPGMRELGLWHADDGLDRAFADIEELIAGCRFADCRHGSEPGCAVHAALEAGELPKERWLSYQKLKQETARSEDMGAYLSAKEQKFKSISKINKSARRKH